MANQRAIARRLRNTAVKAKYFLTDFNLTSL